MGRRRSNGARDFVELVGILPWWVGVAGALISWPLCQFLMVHFQEAAAAGAAQAAASRGRLTGFDAVAVNALLHGLASAGRFVLPLLFGIGAVASWLARRKGEALLRAATGSASTQAVSAMSWQDFEQLVGAYFRKQGFEVHRTGGSGPDGGVDLQLRRDGELTLVQCKQWRAFTVGVGVVRELYGVMAAQGAVGGYVVTSGRFTSEAQAFAAGRNIVLVDGAKLAALLAANPRQPPRARPGPSAAAAAGLQAAAAPAAASASSAAPACPACGGEMVRRLARKGAHAGEAFWGCLAYPKCRGTVRESSTRPSA